MKADIELDAGIKTFASGLLPELITALRRTRTGDLLCLRSRQPGIRDDIVHAGGTWRDSPVVRDGNWVSSRTPEDLKELERRLVLTAA